MFQEYLDYTRNLYTELSNSQDFIHYILLPAIGIILYGLYYKKFHYYTNRHKLVEGDPKLSRRRGTAPPSFPNGWFKVLSSWQLKRGDSKYINTNGRHIVVFRGEDGIVYCLSAYCGHMGANLGEGGQVKWNSCIECPFHGWTYNGKDGKCVNSKNLDAKKVEHVAYDEDFNGKGGFLKPCKQNTTNYSQIDKYEVCEQDGLIYIWFHSQNKPPMYKLGSTKDFQFSKSLVQTAETQEYVNAHIQEIPENGGDFKHLQIVHACIFQCIYPHVQYKWVPRAEKLDSKTFDQTMRSHKEKTIEKLQNGLYDDFKKVNQGEEGDHVNVLAIDSYITFFDGWYDLKVGTATVFQIGSGTVYLFLKLRVLGKLLLIQTVTPVKKFTLEVGHKLFKEWWLPSWLAAQFMNGYNSVLNQDLRIWNNKIFTRQAAYGKDNNHDIQLKKWRENYAKYYEGCQEWEKKQDHMIW